MNVSYGAKWFHIPCQTSYRTVENADCQPTRRQTAGRNWIRARKRRSRHRTRKQGSAGAKKRGSRCGCAPISPPEALETLWWIMWTKGSVEALSRFKQNKRAIWLNKPSEEKQTGFWHGCQSHAHMSLLSTRCSLSIGSPRVELHMERTEGGHWRESLGAGEAEMWDMSGWITPKFYPPGHCQVGPGEKQARFLWSCLIETVGKETAWTHTSQRGSSSNIRIKKKTTLCFGGKSVQAARQDRSMPWRGEQTSMSARRENRQGGQGRPCPRTRLPWQNFLLFRFGKSCLS